jgi:ketosteroid isomerase-like protein
MPVTDTRTLAQDFYRAYASRDVAALAGFIDDEVEWTVSGPVDILPFCGTRHGRQAVLDLIAREVPQVFRLFSFVLDQMLVDGERIASLIRLLGHAPDDRVVRYRLAHFLRFRNGRIVENQSLIESFDTEEAFGHPLAVYDIPPPEDLDD